MAQLLQVVNLQDGYRVSATLSSPAIGNLSFWVSRTPEQVGDTVFFVQTGVDTYTVSASPILQGTPWPCWITAVDDSGPSVQLPVWVLSGTDLTIPEQVAVTLQNILIQNKGLLDARLLRLSTTPNPLSVSQILFGMGEEIDNYPAINISVVDFQEEQGWALPFGNLVTIQASILAFGYHQSDVSWRNVIGALGYSIRDVLNQQQYVQQNLPSGLQWVLGNCTKIHIQEDFSGGKFLTTAEVFWTCQILVSLP